MKALFALMLTLILGCFGSLSAGEGGKPLPSPQMSGGEALFDVINKRSSGAAFTGAVDDQELATILWAATGRNRNDGGWTVPMAMGRPPYVAIYVAGANGAFRYDWETHSLIQVSEYDVRTELGMQDFAKVAYYNLVFVVDSATVNQLSRQEAEILGGYAVGAMTQHIYLACAALGVKGRFIMSVNKEPARAALNLGKDKYVACIMTLGK